MPQEYWARLEAGQQGRPLFKSSRPAVTRAVMKAAIVSMKKGDRKERCQSTQYYLPNAYGASPI